MSLIQRLNELTTTIAREIRSRVTADHPGIAKAWVCFGVVDGQVRLRAAHNVRAVRRLATGRYRVCFAAPMPDDRYAWVAFVRHAGWRFAVRLAAARAERDVKTRRHVDLVCTTVLGTPADASEISVVVYR